MKRFAVLLIFSCLALGVARWVGAAQQDKNAPPVKQPVKAASAHIIVNAHDAKFIPVPIAVGLPTIIEMSTVAGDPSKPGPFSLLLKIPAGQVIAPHWHPGEENVVPLGGTFEFGDGNKFDEAKLHALTPGLIVHVPARMHHFARAQGVATVLVYGMGPFVITYVNPKDDPRLPARTPSGLHFP
jgi:hypothetical protein